MTEKNFYILYKTTNTVNGKEYIGIHGTNVVDDGYLGSGLFLKRAIRKYGKQFFVRTDLEFFRSFKDAAKRESEVVNEEYVSRENTYNFKVGGSGGDTLMERCWANNSIEEKFFYESEIPNGWEKGRLTVSKFKDKEYQLELHKRRLEAHSPEERSEAMKKAWAEGKLASRDHSKCGRGGDDSSSKRPEVREKFRQHAKIRSETILICPVCGKEGADSPGMYRWHFSNCKRSKS